MVNFSLVSTPGKVNPPARDNFLIVSRPFECDRTLSCPKFTLPITLFIRYVCRVFVLQISNQTPQFLTPTKGNSLGTIDHVALDHQLQVDYVYSSRVHT